SGIALAPALSTAQAQALVTKALAFGRPLRAAPEPLQSCAEERQTLGDDHAHVDPVRCALPRADDKTATTTPTPGTGGTTQPGTGGTPQPSTGGAPSPDTGGTTQPSTGGTTQPSTGGTTQPSTGGATQPSTGGTAQPSTGTPSPDTGASQPSAT